MFTSSFVHQDIALSSVCELRWLVRERDANATFVCSLHGLLCSWCLCKPSASSLSFDSYSLVSFSLAFALPSTYNCSLWQLKLDQKNTRLCFCYCHSVAWSHPKGGWSEFWNKKQNSVEWVYCQAHLCLGLRWLTISTQKIILEPIALFIILGKCGLVKGSYSG